MSTPFSSRPAKARLGTAVVASLMSLLAGPALAETRLITVTGDADVRVPPDEVNIVLGIETPDREIAVAARKNAEQVRGVVAMARDFKIDAKDIGTDQISLDKQTEYINGKHQFKEYLARRTVSLRLRELGRFEDLLIVAMKGGATSIQSVQFCTSQLRKFRDQARAQAIKAASEKAADMARLLAQRVGKPHAITETHDGWSVFGSARGALYGNVQNTVQTTGGAASESSGVGLITVNAKVTIAFELE